MLFIDPFGDLSRAKESWAVGVDVPARTMTPRWIGCQSLSLLNLRILKSSSILRHDF